METKKSVFETLNAINCNEHTEKKSNLTYLSWAWAWGMVKKEYPGAKYTIYENESGWFYFTDGKTCWVKTGVTIDSLEHIEYLPVMDFRNKSITADTVTSFDVNKAIQRSLTKACARHGLGLYIYAGEDLPEGEMEITPEAKKIVASKLPELLVNDSVKFPAAKTFVDDQIQSGKKPHEILHQIKQRYSIPTETQIALNL